MKIRDEGGDVGKWLICGGYGEGEWLLDVVWEGKKMDHGIHLKGWLWFVYDVDGVCGGAGVK